MQRVLIRVLWFSAVSHQSTN